MVSLPVASLSPLSSISGRAGTSHPDRRHLPPRLWLACPLGALGKLSTLEGPGGRAPPLVPTFHSAPEPAVVATQHLTAAVCRGRARSLQGAPVAPETSNRLDNAPQPHLEVLTLSHSATVQKSKTAVTPDRAAMSPVPMQHAESDSLPCWHLDPVTSTSGPSPCCHCHSFPLPGWGRMLFLAWPTWPSLTLSGSATPLPCHTPLPRPVMAAGGQEGAGGRSGPSHWALSQGIDGLKDQGHFYQLASQSPPPSLFPQGRTGKSRRDRSGEEERTWGAGSLGLPSKASLDPSSRVKSCPRRSWVQPGCRDLVALTCPACA